MWGNSHCLKKRKGMYDTITMRLDTTDGVGRGYIDRFPQIVGEDNCTVEVKAGSLIRIKADIDGLNMAVTPFDVRVCIGSLGKWVLGDNVQTLSRGDTAKAMEKLSDMMHLPMNQARVTRFDIGKNIPTKHGFEVYVGHFGEMGRYKRGYVNNTLYYETGTTKVCVYDKLRQVKDDGGEIPELYRDCNLLRFEVRYFKRLPKIFKQDVMGETLTDEDFYIDVGKRWLKAYRQIHKINDICMDIGAMRMDGDGRKDVKKWLYKFCLAHYTQSVGGETALVGQFKERQRKGEIDNKTFFVLKRAIMEAGGCARFSTKNDAIEELDKKMEMAMKFIR